MSHPIPEQSELFRRAAEGASAALATWLGRPARIAIGEVRRVPLEQAVALLGPAEATVVACPMQITGIVPGVLLLACDDTSGLALAALLLGREPAETDVWNELAESAAVETANIIGCAYLNALVAAAESAGGSEAPAEALLPSPPWFMRDYAGAVMEAVVMTQAAVAAEVFLTHTDFVIEGSPITCSLLFVPAADRPG
jgi:chemotaxis protein CheC